jgi:hypothetical protein
MSRNHTALLAFSPEWYALYRYDLTEYNGPSYNADPTISVKINANIYLPNAENFYYTRSAKHVVAAYEKNNYCLKN